MRGCDLRYLLFGGWGEIVTQEGISLLGQTNDLDVGLMKI